MSAAITSRLGCAASTAAATVRHMSVAWRDHAGCSSSGSHVGPSPLPSAQPRARVAVSSRLVVRGQAAEGNDERRGARGPAQALGDEPGDGHGLLGRRHDDRDARVVEVRPARVAEARAPSLDDLVEVALRDVLEGAEGGLVEPAGDDDLGDADVAGGGEPFALPAVRGPVDAAEVAAHQLGGRDVDERR